MSEGETADRGWGKPAQSRKYHYFVGARALCNRWMYTGHLEDEYDEHAENCAACEREVAKLRAKERAT